MRNGGGPACLRLRVPMNGAQLSAVKTSVNVFADEKLLAAVTKLIEQYYPQELSPQDLGNPELYHRCQAMLGELAGCDETAITVASSVEALAGNLENSGSVSHTGRQEINRIG